MYYITPITENPYIKEQIRAMTKKNSQDKALPTKQHKNLKRQKICADIEIFLMVLFLIDILCGFHFILHDTDMNVYYFINENIIPVIYLIAYLALSVYKKYPDLTSIKANFYFRIYIFFLIYTAFCNVLTSYHMSGYILFLITGFGLAILYLAYFIYTSGKALDSFIETTTKHTTNPRS